MAAAATASQSPLPNGTHQAGGGVSGEVYTVRTLKGTTLLHLQKIYADYAGSDKNWSLEKAAAFLRDVQHDTDADRAVQLARGGSWDFDTFLHYMTSCLTHAVAPLKKEDVDLSWPLSNYFVSSSHNTYLTGNQLSSKSSADAYRNVLLRGCRCIEIDVWDGEDPEWEGSDYGTSDEDEGSDKKEKMRRRLSMVADKLPRSLTQRLEQTSLGKKFDQFRHKRTTSASTSTTTGTDAATPTVAADAPLENPPASPLKKTISPREPRVLHGYTLTKEVSFREVCGAIRDCAFVMTSAPLIVSLEVHCSAPQQETMVAIMKEAWGDFLLPEPKEDAQELPSPADLRKKILVKVKYVPPEGGGSPTTTEGEETPGPVPAPDGTPTKKKKKASKIIQALSKLGIYTRGVSFKSLGQPEASMPTHIFSLSEGGVAEVHQKSPRELFEHNRRFLMRTYPSGLRIRSSNLDPAVFWRKGIQIVALNWQHWDAGMMLNEAMFAGTKGYVLKPEGYRIDRPLPLPSSAPPPNPQALAVTHYTMDLTIHVFAAQALPLPHGETTNPASFRPYLKVEVHVEEPGERHGTAVPSPTDPLTTTTNPTPNQDPSTLPSLPSNGREKEGEYKARTRSLRGADPDFAGQELRLEGIPGVVPALSFVRFLVRNDELGRDALAAWACVRVDRLREGFRFVHLLDAAGVETEGVVLVKVGVRLR